MPDVTFIDGTYTITARPVKVEGIAVAAKTYDGTTEVITWDYSDVTFDDIIDGDEINVTASGAFETKAAGENKKVIINEITLDNSNYSVSDESQTEAFANINKKDIVVTGIKAKEKVYDKTPDATIDYAKMVLDGTLAFDCDYTKDSVINNKYDITPKGLTSENYDIEFVKGELSVTPIPLTFTAPTAKTDLVYNGQPQILVNPGSVTGGVLEYLVQDGWTTDYTIKTQTRPGNYTVYYRVVPDENHTGIAATEIKSDHRKSDRNGYCV